MKYTHAHVMQGLGLFGAAMDLNPASIFPGFLSGKFDEEVSVALFWQQKGRLPETEQDLSLPEILTHLDRCKKAVIWKIEGVLRAAEQENLAEKQRQLEQVRAELAQRNRPSTAGTVAEIAARYGISKSEVRRWRAAGTLEEELMVLELKDMRKNATGPIQFS